MANNSNVDHLTNQTECETLCSNNVNCASYECWSGYRSCWLFSFASGVTSVSSAQLSSHAKDYPGCIYNRKNKNMS